MYSVLIVDDFAIDRQNLADAVRSFNKLPLHIIGVCENAYDALEIIRNMETDILICDVEMPGMTGIELASTLRAESFHGRIIFCSLYDKLPGPPCVVGTLVVKEKQIMENSPADNGIIPHQLAAD